MAFIKTGDPMTITNFINDDDIVVTCKTCHEPLTTVVIDEDDGIKVACSCEYPEVEADNA